MASYATIQLNYQKAIRQANQLEDLANDLRNIANRNVDDALDQVAANWKGDSANMFLQKGNKAKNDLIASAKQLSNTAKAIRKAAENVRRAELEAKRIAEMIAKRASGK